MMYGRLKVAAHVVLHPLGVSGRETTRATTAEGNRP